MNRPAILPKMRRNSKGFTLVELLVAVIVLGIISALAYPSYIALIERNRVVAAAEAIYNHLHLARSEAIKSNADVFVKFSKDSAWCLALATTSNCTCGASATCTYNGVVNQITSADFPDITISSTLSDTTNAAQALGGKGQFQAAGRIAAISENYQVDVVISRLGRIRLCLDSGKPSIGGYSAC